MTNARHAPPTATSVERLESALAELMARDPSDALLARLDDRVQGAIASPRTRPAGRRLRIGRRPLALLAAAAVFIGAAGPLGLYDGLGAGFDYGFSIQLARSVAVGATAVDDGYRVTIDRAYLDAERLMLAVRVTDERRRPQVTQLSAMYSVVSDDAGVWPGAGVATSHPIGPWAATQVQWRLAPAPMPKGTHRIHVEIPHIFWRDTTTPVNDTDSPWHEQTGHWSFDLELPVDGGATVVHPDTAIEIDGVRVSVDEVVFGPSAIRVKLANHDGTVWSAVGSIRRGGERYPFVVGKAGDPGIIAVQTDGGTDHPSGTWSIVIDAVDRAIDGGEQRVEGPWEFVIDVP